MKLPEEMAQSLSHEELQTVLLIAIAARIGVTEHELVRDTANYLKMKAERLSE
jgi:hypothetical protein